MTSVRPSAYKRRARVLRSAAIETLEPRKMLTSLTNGIFDNTGSNVMEYRDAEGQIIRVSVQGNVTGELLGLRTIRTVGDAKFNVRSVVNLVPPTADNDDEGVDLYNIYIAAADADASISIAVVDDLDADARPMTPFDGDFGTLRHVTPGGDGAEASLMAATGGVYIGARTGDYSDDIDDEDGIPITGVAFTPAVGNRPASGNGRLQAGIETGSNVSLGRLLIGGTISGKLAISGSVDTIYAGNILTGATIGQEFGSTAIENSFFVGGDLRNLVVSGSIGTDQITGNIDDIDYTTGTQIVVNGHLGAVKILGDSLAQYIVGGGRITGTSQNQNEIEQRFGDAEDSDSYFQGDIPDFSMNATPGLGDSDAFQNDSFATAEVLGGFYDTNTDAYDSVTVTGNLSSYIVGNTDNVDYYAVPVISQQTVTITLTQELNSLTVGVFDPEGRFIESSYDNGFNSDSQVNQTISFTADRPGLYRIAVASYGDANFDGTSTGLGTESRLATQETYTLTVGNLDDLSFAGVYADNNIYFEGIGSDDDLQESILVQDGDLGGVVAGAGLEMFGGDFTTAGTSFQSLPIQAINAVDGNIRVIHAANIGQSIINTIGTTSIIQYGIDIAAGKSVGLLQSTGSMIVNLGTVDSDDQVTDVRVGEDYEWVKAGSTFVGNLVADRGIGVIQAQQIGVSTFAGVFSVNADESNDDGVIDLIDVTGDLGTLTFGGPAITTGQGGNVRYIRVGGIAYRDRFFGGGTNDVTTYALGETASLTDDSGTRFSLTPQNPGFGTSITGGITLRDPDAFLSIRTYPIRDKGGVVLIDVFVSGADRGVTIGGRGGSGGGSVEIGDIVVAGTAATYSYSASSRTVSPPTLNAAIGSSTANNLAITANGANRVDIYKITADELTSYNNSTNGELINVTASNVGLLDGNLIGLGKSSTGMKVEAQTGDLPNVFPFSQTKTGIVLTGGDNTVGSVLGEIRSRQGVGNVYVEGVIGYVTANSDNVNTRRVSEGIEGILYASDAGGANSGNILRVDIGEGLSDGGGGDALRTGIFADGYIDRVSSTVGSDIRGSIVASGDGILAGGIGLRGGFAIGTIDLRGGSLIGAEVLVAELEDARETNLFYLLNQSTGSLNNAVPEIGTINVSGGGGIIGSVIAASDVGDISVSGGFGIFQTTIFTEGAGTVRSVSADGYGIRQSYIGGGARVGSVNVTGGGSSAPVTDFTGSLLDSPNRDRDPYTGRVYDESNDLYKALGVTEDAPKRKGRTSTGYLEDVTIIGSQSFDSISAYRIIGRTAFSPLGTRFNFTSASFPTRISFGNEGGSITSLTDMESVAIVTGGLDHLDVGSYATYVSVRSTGRIERVDVGSTLKGTSIISATGPEGSIGTVNVGGGLYGQVVAQTRLGRVNVGADVGSPYLRSFGSFDALTVAGSILGGAFIRASGPIRMLSIGGDIAQNSTVRATSYGTQSIGGVIFGDLVVG